MDLIALAEDAQEIASAFTIFEDYLPAETAADISALVTELFGIKTVLLDLNSECREPRNARNAEELDDEQYVVVKSLEYTFKDVHRLLGGLAQGRYRSKREAYRAVWRKLDDYFYEESRNQLVDRLHYYKTFIEEITNLVVGHRQDPDFDDLFARIEHLLDTQEEDGRFNDEPDPLALGTPRQTRSWERRRPYGLNRHGQPNGRGPPRDQQHNRRPGYRPPASPGFPEGGFPLSPGVSGSSPPSTVTTSSLAESSSASSTMPKHWLIDVWSQQRSNTQFHTTGAESACFGEHARGASKRLREERHERLLTLPFEQNSSLELRIYFRERDRRARIWCRTERRQGHVEAVQPIANLRILRKDSCLQLCKPDSHRRLRLWANLRFISYERMVLFHCSFLALKAQEQSGRGGELDDHILHGEITVMSAKIQDDNFVHALQVFKDEDSGGVRLQASVLRGSLKRSPVWTAFIKYSMMAREWIRQSEPRKVLLSDLSRYIFTDNYEPQMAPTGEHELHFMSRDDATQFMEAIEDVAEGRI